MTGEQRDIDTVRLSHLRLPKLTPPTGPEDVDTRVVTPQWLVALVIPRGGGQPEPSQIKMTIPKLIFAVSGGVMELVKGKIQDAFDGVPSEAEQVKLAYDVYLRLKQAIGRVSRDLRLISQEKPPVEMGRTYTVTNGAESDLVGHLAYLFLVSQIKIAESVTRDDQTARAGEITEHYSRLVIPGRLDATRGYILALVERESGSDTPKTNYGLQIISRDEWKAITFSGVHHQAPDPQSGR